MKYSRRLFGFLLSLLFFFAWGPPDDARALDFKDNPYLGPAPEISVLTFGPGDAAFLKFGHNAIRVKDNEKKTDLVYNFGTFQFDNPTLILDFLTGKFKYWLSVSTFRRTLHAYKSNNRDVMEQRLNIGKPKARELAKALATNALPENREYIYDYYRDNCSTRVRDVIDSTISRGLETRFQDDGQLTLREHTLRAVADDFWLYLGLDIAMGSYIDQPETRWGEMFLPQKLHDGLGSVVFHGAHGSASLVKKTKVWHEAKDRPRLRNEPPDRTLSFLQAGAALGALLAFFGWEGYRRRKRFAQVVGSLLVAAFGLTAGILSLLFLGLWLLTDHQVAFHNENLLQCVPWALALPVTAWGLARGTLWSCRLARRVAAAGLLTSAAGLLFKLLPFMFQDNARIIALFLPVWLGVAAFCHFSYLRAKRLVAHHAEDALTD